MTTIHFTEVTTSMPEQFIAGLTDFGPGRSKLFANSQDDYLKVHSQGPTTADVTEGSPSAWERLNYDWSDPNRVVLTTTDSNPLGRLRGDLARVGGRWPRRSRRIGRAGAVRRRVEQFLITDPDGYLPRFQAPVGRAAIEQP